MYNRVEFNMKFYLNFLCISFEIFDYFLLELIKIINELLRAGGKNLMRIKKEFDPILWSPPPLRTLRLGEFCHCSAVATEICIGPAIHTT